MTHSTQIYVRFTFEALHRYADAPDEVKFLSNPHRHLFYCEVGFDVHDLDREREFFIERRKLIAQVQSLMENPNHSEWSCEQWALNIMQGSDAIYVSVSEDNENGARVKAG